MEQCSATPSGDVAAVAGDSNCSVTGDGGSCWRRQLFTDTPIDSRFFLPGASRNDELQKVFQQLCENMMGMENRLQNNLAEIRMHVDKINVEQRCIAQQQVRNFELQKEISDTCRRTSLMSAAPVAPSKKASGIGGHVHSEKNGNWSRASGIGGHFHSEKSVKSARDGSVRIMTPKAPMMFDAPVRQHSKETKEEATLSVKATPNPMLSKDASMMSMMSVDTEAEVQPDAIGMEGDGAEKQELVTMAPRKAQAGGANFIGSMAPDMSNLEAEEYHVEDFYNTSGFCQAMARNENYSNLTLLVITANAIYIGVDADNNHTETLADAAIGFQVCENIFCIFFVSEWIFRFGAFADKSNCLRDMWFKFDSCLVMMMVFETWIMTYLLQGFIAVPFPTSMIKLFRLLRLARMVRLTKALPELVAMVKGVKVASRAVGSALLMMFLLIMFFPW